MKKKPKAVMAWGVLLDGRVQPFDIHASRLDAKEQARHWRLVGYDEVEVIRVRITPVSRRRAT